MLLISWSKNDLFCISFAINPTVLKFDECGNNIKILKWFKQLYIALKAHKIQFTKGQGLLLHVYMYIHTTKQMWGKMGLLMYLK